MVKYAFLAGLIFFMFGCKQHDEIVIPSTPLKPTIPGGNGGHFNIAFFPASGKTGVSGICYVKYGCKTIQVSNKTTYNDSSATMIEPGYGPHAHFINLKEGFYLLTAKSIYNSKEVRGDTIIEITSTQAASVDYNLQLK